MPSGLALPTCWYNSRYYNSRYYNSRYYNGRYYNRLDAVSEAHVIGMPTLSTNKSLGAFYAPTTIYLQRPSRTYNILGNVNLQA